MAKTLAPEDYQYIVDQLSAKGMSPEQIKATMSQHGYEVEDPYVSMAKAPFEAVLKAADYGGALTRNLVGQGVEAATDSDLKTPALSDVATLQAQQPTTSEMMESGGILAENPKTRALLGFAGDVAMDPITLATLGGSAVAKGAGKLGMQTLASGATRVAEAAQKADILGNLLADAAKGVGKGIHGYGVRALDKAAEKRGAEAVSPYMFEQNMWGRNSSLQDQMQGRLNELMNQRTPLYKAIEEQGVKISPAASNLEAQQVIAGVKENPYKAGQAQAMLDYLNLAKDPMSISQASKVKTDLYNSLPQSAFDQFGRKSPDWAALEKAQARGLKNEIEQAAEYAIPGAGSRVSKINEEMGSYLGALKPNAAEAAREGKKAIQTQVDAMSLLLDPMIWAGKNVMRAANATPVTTGAGVGIKKLAEEAPTALWRQLLLAPTNRGE